LESISVAQNPISVNPTFPNLPNLKSLNLSQTGISKLDDNLLNLENLETLNVSGNCISDFDFIDLLTKLEFLTEVDLYDPKFGPNPVCALPNYDCLTCALLPRLQVLDCYRIPDRFHTICSDRQREVDLFYDATLGTELTTIDGDWNSFLRAISDIFSAIPKPSLVALPEIEAEIGTLVSAAEGFEKFCRLSNESARKTGGNLAFARVDETTEDWEQLSATSSKRVQLPANVQLSAAWSVVCRFNLVDSDGVSCLCQISEDPIGVVRNPDRSRFTPNVAVESPFAFVVFADLLKNETVVAKFVLFFATPQGVLRSRIERICEHVKPMEVVPVATVDTLVALQPGFDLPNSLVSVTLIACEIQDLSVFGKLASLEKLCIPWNELDSLATLPPLPKLVDLDVSFNRICAAIDLVVPPGTAPSLTSLNFFGNPIWDPITARCVPSLFDGCSAAGPGALIELPVFDCTAITNLDVRRNCLSTLSPLGELPHLRTLYAAQNLLANIDFSSNSLVYADFSLNFLTEMPPSSQFPNLLCLFVNCNQISVISEFPTLISLFASQNVIGVLPSQKALPNLAVLHIADNPICDSASDFRVLYELSRLKMLNGTLVTHQAHARARKSLSGLLFAEDVQRLCAPWQTVLDLSGKEYREVNLLASDSVQNLLLGENSLQTIEWSAKAFPRLLSLKLSNN
jgi:Leucine-rich repeat (LRR) protein